jgi:hypothetical protein
MHVEAAIYSTIKQWAESTISYTPGEVHAVEVGEDVGAVHLLGHQLDLAVALYMSR